MMTFNKPFKEAFVRVWLPDETEPVVAGKLTAKGNHILFNYGKSYLARREAIAITDKLMRFIIENWDVVCDEASLSQTDRRYFWGRQYLNTYAFENREGDAACLRTLAEEARA